MKPQPQSNQDVRVQANRNYLLGKIEELIQDDMQGKDDDPVLSHIWMIAHAWNTNHICYGVHDGWRSLTDIETAKAEGERKGRSQMVEEVKKLQFLDYHTTELSSLADLGVVQPDDEDGLEEPFSIVLDEILTRLNGGSHE